MKKILFILTTFVMMTMGFKSYAFPYWDANPQYQFSSTSTVLGPIIATTNALFAIHTEPSENYLSDYSIARWTECGGWENIPGLQLYTWDWGQIVCGQMMTVHGHYLYAVGLLKLSNYTNGVNYLDIWNQLDYAPYTNAIQIAKFDLDTGVWTPLGQNFSATNVVMPTTIAVDDSNRIYVGFAVTEPTGSNILNGQTVDMLDVSTNDGASWQTVGGGLIVEDDEFDVYSAAVTALCAHGTNLYIGGDFQAIAGNISSPHVAMWTGNAWQALAGVSEAAPDRWGLAYNVDSINSIVGIGTNIYVGGCFHSPRRGLARFSNVDGASLPLSFDIGTDANGFDSYDWITTLAVNDGHLYVGGDGDFEFADGSIFALSLACLLNPQDPNPTNWIPIVDCAYPGVYSLAGAADGDSVFILGACSDNGVTSDLSRWVTGDSGFAPPTITINGYVSNNCAILNFNGTPGSHWQILSSSDNSTWNSVGDVTLWDGTGTFSESINHTQYYHIQNSCASYSVTVSDELLVNVQFGNFDYYGQALQTGEAAIGISSSDQWNFITGWDPNTSDSPDYFDIGDGEGARGIYSSVLYDRLGSNSFIGITIMADRPYSSDPPIATCFGPSSYPLLGSALSTAGTDYAVSLDLPSGSYDLFLYSASVSPSTFTLYNGYEDTGTQYGSSQTPSSSSTRNMNQNVEFSGLSGGIWTIHVHGGYTIMNGLQIRRTPSN